MFGIEKLAFVLKFGYTDKSLSTKTPETQPVSDTGCFITNASELPNSADLSVSSPNSRPRRTMPLISTERGQKPWQLKGSAWRAC